MNLFDKSSVHRYSVRPRPPILSSTVQPIPFTLIIHPQQKKAIRQNSNLHSPLLRTNKFRVCAQISDSRAGQIQSLAVGQKMCKSRKTNSSKPDVTTGLNSGSLICFHRKICTILIVTKMLVIFIFDKMTNEGVYFQQLPHHHIPITVSLPQHHQS